MKNSERQQNLSHRQRRTENSARPDEDPLKPALVFPADVATVRRQREEHALQHQTQDTVSVLRLERSRGQVREPPGRETAP